MKYHFFLSTLLIFSIILSVYFSNRQLIVYEKTSKENVPDGSGNGFFLKEVTKTYHVNYAAIGGAIAFGVIAAGCVVGLSITLRDKQTSKL